jgi:hypothetical protein
MTDLDILESRLQGLERRMNLVGHLRPRLGAGVVVAARAGGRHTNHDAHAASPPQLSLRPPGARAASAPGAPGRGGRLRVRALGLVFREAPDQPAPAPRLDVPPEVRGTVGPAPPEALHAVVRHVAAALVLSPERARRGPWTPTPR